jgi:hypothetical protein
LVVHEVVGVLLELSVGVEHTMLVKISACRTVVKPVHGSIRSLQLLVREAAIRI